MSDFYDDEPGDHDEDLRRAKVAYRRDSAEEAHNEWLMNGRDS